MRICIDARSLYDVPTGLGRYAANIVSAIAAIDRENEYFVVRRPSRHGALANQPNFHEFFLPYDISSARNIFAGAQVINVLNADLYHALFHFLPRGVYARRVVITLHDLIWVKHAHLGDGISRPQITSPMLVADGTLSLFWAIACPTKISRVCCVLLPASPKIIPTFFSHSPGVAKVPSISCVWPIGLAYLTAY